MEEDENFTVDLVLVLICTLPTKNARVFCISRSSSLLAISSMAPRQINHRKKVSPAHVEASKVSAVIDTGTRDSVWNPGYSTASSTFWSVAIVRFWSSGIRLHAIFLLSLCQNSVLEFVWSLEKILLSLRLL